MLSYPLWTDQIRPDWEAKLAAVRAAVARRANRRIIMRQVGDRLIPVGVTSGRIQPLNVDGAQGEPDGPEGESRSSRRSRRRQHQQAPQDLSHLLGSMGLGGQDLEEVRFTILFRKDSGFYFYPFTAHGYGSHATLINGT